MSSDREFGSAINGAAQRCESKWEEGMAERKQQIVCIVDPSSPKISAYDIHEWIFEQLHMPEEAIRMIQIDGTKKHVYLKLSDETYNRNTAKDKRTLRIQTTGETSIVRLEMAGMGTRRVRIANLPPETSDRALRMALAPYGEIVAIHEENWSTMYRYLVANGVRVATIKLDKHMPSHLSIAGDRAIVSYEGQPVYCYACGGTGHMRHTCSHRRSEEHDATSDSDKTWAKIAASGKSTQGKVPGENRKSPRRQRTAIHS